MIKFGPIISKITKCQGLIFDITPFSCLYHVYIDSIFFVADSRSTSMLSLGRIEVEIPSILKSVSAGMGELTGALDAFLEEYTSSKWMDTICFPGTIAYPNIRGSMDNVGSISLSISFLFSALASS